MKKLSLVLVLAMTLALFSAPVYAAETPVYRDLEPLAIAMRDAMRERQEEVTFLVSKDIEIGDSSWLDTDPYMQYTDEARVQHCAFRLATSQKLAETPYDGDYLEDQFWHFAAADTPYRNTTPNTLALHFKMMYRTTLEEQREVEVRVSKINESLSLDGMTDYQKVKTIEQWIRENIAYDFNAEPSNLRHTAWQGLVQGSCVCEGKAQIFYLLCHINGIPCRIVKSTPTKNDNVGHSFNIVQIGNDWYFADPTNDAASEAISTKPNQPVLSGSFRGWDTASCYEQNATDLYRIESCNIANYCYVPTFEEEPLAAQIYPDVTFGDWFEYPIRATTVHGIFNGLDDGLFHPSDEVSVGQLATVLHRLSKDSGDNEETTGLWYEPGMNWALANGALTTTDPAAPASRDEAISALYRVFSAHDDRQSLSTANHIYIDQSKIANPAAVNWAFQNGYMVGYSDNSFRPDGMLTRAEFAAIVQRIVSEEIYPKTRRIAAHSSPSNATLLGGPLCASSRV